MRRSWRHAGGKGGKIQLAQQLANDGPIDMGNAFWKLYVNTNDIDAMYEAAIDFGSESIMEPQRLERWPTSVGFVKDPDGYLVEFVQRHPWLDGDDTTQAWVGQYCIYVSDIAAARKFWETLGLTCTSETDIPNVKEAILENPDKGGKIQLAQKLEDDVADRDGHRDVEALRVDRRLPGPLRQAVGAGLHVGGRADAARALEHDDGVRRRPRRLPGGAGHPAPRLSTRTAPDRARTSGRSVACPDAPAASAWLWAAGRRWSRWWWLGRGAGALRPAGAEPDLDPYSWARRVGRRVRLRAAACSRQATPPRFTPASMDDIGRRSARARCTSRSRTPTTRRRTS